MESVLYRLSLGLKRLALEAQREAQQHGFSFPRRPNKWERPTLMDVLERHPVVWIASCIYAFLLWLREPTRWPWDRRHQHIPGTTYNSRLRVVCISDTHDQTVDLPPGDLLVHAGDMTNSGTLADIQRQLDWIAAQPHKHKVVVAGNHDRWFDPLSRTDEDKATGAKPDFKGIHYLEHKSTLLHFNTPGGNRVLSIHGAPGVLPCGGSEHAFQYEDENGDIYEQPNDDFLDATTATSPWSASVPSHTHILVTHSPPKFHRDLGLGSASLLRENLRVQPDVHIFGHVHWGSGIERLHGDERTFRYYHAMLREQEKGMSHEELCRLAWGVIWTSWQATVDALWPPWERKAYPYKSCLLVNAAAMVGNTGRMGNMPQIIII